MLKRDVGIKEKTSDFEQSTPGSEYLHSGVKGWGNINLPASDRGMCSIWYICVCAARKELDEAKVQMIDCGNSLWVVNPKAFLHKYRVIYTVFT